MNNESQERRSLVSSLIEDVPDFPKPGVMFKDITPLLASARGFQAAVTELVTTAPRHVDVVVGMEARGFIFAAPVALALGLGFVPIRKPGKLPGPIYAEEYALEYGTNTLNIHQDAIAPGQKVLVIDDLVATAGTILAAKKLIERCGGELAHVEALVELTDLGGRQILLDAGVPSYSAILEF